MELILWSILGLLMRISVILWGSLSRNGIPIPSLWLIAGMFINLLEGSCRRAHVAETVPCFSRAQLADVDCNVLSHRVSSTPFVQLHLTQALFHIQSIVVKSIHVLKIIPSCGLFFMRPLRISGPFRSEMIITVPRRWQWNPNTRPDREPHQISYAFLLPHWDDETTYNLRVER